MQIKPTWWKWLDEVPVCSQERSAYYKISFWPILCHKRIGLPCCTFVTITVTCSLRNYLAIKILATYNFSAGRHYLAENRLSFPSTPHWVRHSYLSKGLRLTPYTCGSSRLFSSGIAREWSAFGEWNSVRKNLYYMLKFIVTCYYGESSFEGFVLGIFTLNERVKSYPSTY